MSVNGVTYGVPGPGLVLPLDTAIDVDNSATDHTITTGNQASLFTYVGTSQFGAKCLLLDGTDDYISAADHADWDVCGNASSNYTIDLYVKHVDHADVETYIAQFEGAAPANYWALSHTHGSGVSFVMYKDNSKVIDTGKGGEITDTTTWHHVAMCKVGADYGVYVDGVQVAHTNNSDTDTFAGTLFIGIMDGTNYAFDGYIDNVRVTTVNAFGAAPVAGLTDTITLPSASHDYSIDVAGETTIAEQLSSIVTAINGNEYSYVSASVSGATSVMLESKVRGTAGNLYALTKGEAGTSTDDISVSGSVLGGGGVATSTAEQHCKATLTFPDEGDVITSSTWAAFEALFDTVDVFRTINLGTGSTATQGAIFYLEQTISKGTPNWSDADEWDALTVTIGTKVDEALPFQVLYNPETDICLSPPDSGTIGMYQKTTFMSEAVDVDGGLDTVHSSIEHSAGDYFTTYNRRTGGFREGRPMRYLTAGDSMFVLCPNAVVHVYKSSKYKPLQFVALHEGRGLAGKYAAHTVGNSIVMLTNSGVVMLNGSDGTMSQVSAANRVIRDDWAGDLSTIQSGYDSIMDTSYFLHPGDSEILQICHSSKSASIIEGADFVCMTSGPDVTDNTKERAYFITDRGLIVTPDYDQSGSGTMWGVSGNTLNDTATGGSTTTVVATGATLTDDVIGCLLYCVSGTNAGLAREISGINNETKTWTVAAFPAAVAVGDRFAVNPVPFRVRLWALRDLEAGGVPEAFSRWVMSAIGIKVRKLVGLSSNDNDAWRIGVYRNSDSTMESATNSTVTLDLDANPADSVAALEHDGVDIEPVIEFISSGTSFELTDAEIYVTVRGSKNVTA